MAFNFLGKRWFLLILVLLFFLFNYLLSTTLPVDLVLDLKFLYGPEMLSSSLNQMGQEGRSNYFNGLLFLDMPYVFVYAILFCRIMKHLWLGSSLYLITLAIASADFLENLLMMYHIRSFPEVSSPLAYLTSGLTSLKWVLVLIFFTLIIAGLLKKIFIPHQEKTHVH